VGLVIAVLVLFRIRARRRPAPVVDDVTPAGDPVRADPEPVAAAPPEPVAAATPEPVAAAPPEPVAAVPEPSEPVPERLERVTALQRQLAWLGFDPGPIDGHYGSLTTVAVERFQRAQGLAVDGVVSPTTAELLSDSAPAPTTERMERVKALQRQLGWLGFEPGLVDGSYGPLTTGAVKRFQETHELKVDGVVDQATADALRASIAQRPSSGRLDRVKALQRQLTWLGFEPGPVDGRYGPRTTDAVRRFQDSHDLPVDGVVGSDTRTALEQSILHSRQR
jgi:peptidoglycan hydrolase-like protein with peptidoglycan-binding domain